MATTAAVTTATSSAEPKYGAKFFEGLWRSSGVQGVAFLVVGTVLAGFGPGVGASSESLASYYAANSTRILIATPILGLGILNLMWFASAIRTALSEAGRDGWGASATASSAAFGAIAFVLIAAQAALAYSVAGTGNVSFITGINDLGWAAFVLSALPRAMLIMSGTFGFWRAGIISDRNFTIGVGAVFAGVFASTTWLPGGFWAPDGLYSAVIFPIIGLVWVVAAGRVLAKLPISKNGF